MANAGNKRGDQNKSRIGDNKQASGKEEMDVVGPRPQNGLSLTSTNRSNMGA